MTTMAVGGTTSSFNLPEDQEDTLLVFFHCASTGLDISTHKIIQIGAKVVQQHGTFEEIQDDTFQEFVHTNDKIPAEATRRNRIVKKDLEDADPFDKVFPRFLDWVNKKLDIVSKLTKRPHHLVFVAHYGFRYDFPLLFTEMERNEIDFNVFEENGVLFCDTCKNFKRLQKENVPSTQNMGSSLERIYTSCFPYNNFKGYQALEYASSLAEVITKADLNLESLISNLESFDQQYMDWRDHLNSKKLMVFKLKSRQRKSLLKKGLTYEELEIIFLSCECDLAKFKQELRGKGIRSAAIPICIGQVLKRKA